MPTLTIAPLSTPQTMSRAVWQAVTGADRLYLQTELHPSAKPVLETGLAHISMDDLYASLEDYDALNQAIAQRLVEGDGGVYAVMGSGCGAQLPYIQAACREKGWELVLLPGVSYAQAAFPQGEEGVYVHCNSLPRRPDTDLPLYIDEVDNRLLAGGLKNYLQDYYPDEHPVTLAVQTPQGGYAKTTLPLYALDRQEGFFSSTVVLVPPVAFDKKERYGYEDLLYVLRRLRSPEGCPWDREQTHESLKTSMREECYEFMDAVEEDDPVHMAEELGDILMLVLFHCVMGEETGDFTDMDVTDGIVKKMVYRHPHVFGQGRADSAAEVLQNWETLKKAEKGQTTVTETLTSVPRSFPALLRAQKVQGRARRAGFDYDKAQDAFYKIPEETKELLEAMEAGAGSENIRKEMGDLFFACVNVCRLLGLDCEETVQGATEKFIRRFGKMEALAEERGWKLEGLSLAEQDKLWEKAKALEKI